jgi:hypothetical protein
LVISTAARSASANLAATPISAREKVLSVPPRLRVNQTIAQPAKPVENAKA